jgi:Ca-activated chloride channel family protein
MNPLNNGALNNGAKHKTAGQIPSNNNKVTIEVIPSCRAVRADGATTLDVLVRIVPPQIESRGERPQLNLGLVIDRSGSMSGAKLRAARQAAIYAVEQLLPQDRISVTVFDNTVQTIVPSTLATDKSSIISRIQRIDTGGTTALYDGWYQGGIQVSQHLDPRGLNRVLLVTDGLANVGETNPDRIAGDVHGLAKRGVSTTTMGVGNDYQEDLLEAMANSGDGNYHFIEGAADFERIFTQEMQGLMATLGNTVSLGIEPQHGVGVVDVYNDLERNSYGRLQLPNLIAGSPIEVVLRLLVPAQSKERDLCFFRLAWNAPGDGERRVVREPLCLPAVSSAQWEGLPQDERVREQVVHKEAVRMRQQAIQEMERGNVEGARQHLQAERAHIAYAAPAAAWLEEETKEGLALEADLEAGEISHATKFAKHASYRKRRSR